MGGGLAQAKGQGKAHIAHNPACSSPPNPAIYVTMCAIVSELSRGACWSQILDTHLAQPAAHNLSRTLYCTGSPMAGPPPLRPWAAATQ